MFLSNAITSVLEQDNKVIVYLINDRNKSYGLDVRLRLRGFDGSILNSPIISSRISLTKSFTSILLS